MMKWLYDLWYERQRQADLKILWPCCREKAPDLDQAKAAFATHAFADPAWLYLGEDHIKQVIAALV
jgi:hypothetical protein